LRDWTRLLRLARPLCGDGLAQLRAHWREHALTLVGIVWGAAAVVLLLSLGAGFHSFLDLGFKKTGDRYVVAWGRYTTTELGGTRPGRAIELDREDFERVRASVPSARWVAAEFQRGVVSARTPHRTRTAILSAGTAELRHIKIHRVARGRFYDDFDDAERRSVAVLGADLPELYFADGRAIGRTIHIDGWPFEVIGVLRKKGNQFVTNNGPHDQMIFIPMGRAQRLFDMDNGIGSLIADAPHPDAAAQVEAELRAALVAHHRIDPGDEEALGVMSLPQLTRSFLQIGVGLKLLLGFIGTLMLAMAGVGVANLMVAVVHQRRVELAMRRACGARRSDVVLQLLLETMVVVVVGGALGVGIGTGLAYATSLLPLPDMLPTPRVSLSVVLTSFAVLAAVGVVAGVVPARVASAVDPASALRVS
jgi:putative ABC transport system permease protein